MPSVTVKLYSVLFKFLLKNRLQSLFQSSATVAESPFGVTSRSEESTVPDNPTFGPDGVATKDIHIDPLTSLTIRIFLPESSLGQQAHRHARRSAEDLGDNSPFHRSYKPAGDPSTSFPVVYRGYLPSVDGSIRRPSSRKIAVVLQFHGGAFVSGSNTSAANDLFCRRIAKLCDVIVVAVGYRLAPENKYPSPFEDGLKVLNWLAKQANLAECSKSMASGKARKGRDARTSDGRRRIVDTFGASTVEPWIAAHGDPTRCLLLGVSCGANIADFVARKAVESGKLLAPVTVVAQVLLYPFFIGSVPTHSEIKLANSYFYDKAMCVLAWKLLFTEEEFNLDHPSANPLSGGRGPPLKQMPPTLTVVAEHDWMRDRAIAYSEELRKVNVDAPVLEYKDAVHEFATLDILLKTPQAMACAEDIAIWMKKYTSIRGHEFSY